jgi:hypothetical protein
MSIEAFPFIYAFCCKFLPELQKIKTFTEDGNYVSVNRIIKTASIKLSIGGLP